MTAADVPQFIKCLGRDERAGASHRVTQRDSAAIGIGFGRVQSKPLFHGNGLRGKRLIGFDDIHLAKRQARLFERQCGGRDLSVAHDLVGDSHNGVRHDVRQNGTVASTAKFN